MTQEPTVILGTGAMAGLFAARLLAAGQSVILLGTWKEALERIANHGLKLIAGNGTESVLYPLATTDDPQSCPPASLALVLVKSWQTERAARQLRTLLARDGIALTLQNGLGNLEKLAAVLGARRVAVGVTTYGATLLAAGVVRAEGEGEIVLEETSRLAELRQRLVAAGFKLRCETNINSLLWGKLALNAAVNPTTALLGVPNGSLLNNPAAWAIVEAVLQETLQVATAHNIQLPYANPRRHIKAILRQTASNWSSMLQDLRRGAPTEIEAINGAIVRIGHKYGLETPVNRLLVLLIKARLRAMAASETA